MQSFRTFFKKEIFAEELLPEKPTSKAVIFCDGAPSVPSKKKLMEFFVKKGYAAIHMRYRGTWESKGVFLKKSPTEDVLDVVDEVSKRYKKIVLVGGSFGGAAVLLAGRDDRVSNVIAISPVVDWQAPSKEESLPEFIRTMKTYYPMVYRTTLWSKLGTRDFYQPAVDIDGRKVFILHAKDDGVVRLKEVVQFAKKTKSNVFVLKRGGHFSSSIIMKPALWKKISKFLKTTPTNSPKS